MHFFPKKHPKFLKRLIFIWEKATFFFEQLFLVVARICCPLRSDSFFLGPKFRFWVQKSDFCHTTPILVNDPILALGMTVNFPPWERFFDFPFRSYSCFRKKIRLTRQKVFPPPTVGVPSASKSPSALSGLDNCGTVVDGGVDGDVNGDVDGGGHCSDLPSLRPGLVENTFQ